MGSCLGKLSRESTVVVGGGALHSEDNGCRTAAAESLTDTVCGGGQQLKQKRSGSSLEEIVNQLIRETLCVIGSIVEK